MVCAEDRRIVEIARCGWRRCPADPTRTLLTDIGVYPPLEVKACDEHADELHGFGWQLVLTPAEAARALGQTDGDSTDG